MNHPSVLIVVPARSGSKGLPRKNTKQLGDLPLLAWTAEAIKRASLINCTALLSTDNEEIARIGQVAGLSVPFFRPNELAQDNSSVVDVALHALSWQCHWQALPDVIMLLQPTSPFRNPETIRQALSLLYEKKVDAVIGVKAIFRSLQTIFYADAQGKLSALNAESEKLATRRQDVEPLLTPNGAMYLVKTEVLQQQKTFFPASIYGLKMDEISSHDIDIPDDWLIAEAFYSAQKTWRHDLKFKNIVSAQNF